MDTPQGVPGRSQSLSFPAAAPAGQQPPRRSLPDLAQHAAAAGITAVAKAVLPGVATPDVLQSSVVVESVATASDVGTLPPQTPPEPSMPERVAGAAKVHPHDSVPAAVPTQSDGQQQAQPAAPAEAQAQPPPQALPAPAAEAPLQAMPPPQSQAAPTAAPEPVPAAATVQPEAPQQAEAVVPAAASGGASLPLTPPEPQQQHGAAEGGGGGGGGVQAAPSLQQLPSAVASSFRTAQSGSVCEPEEEQQPRAGKPEEHVLMSREAFDPNGTSHSQRTCVNDCGDDSTCGHDDTQDSADAPHTPHTPQTHTPEADRSTPTAQHHVAVQRPPPPWTIPPQDVPPSSSWAKPHKPPIDFTSFLPLPVGEDMESRELRRQLFEVMDMTGTGKLSLAELARGVREVLQLEDMLGGECKHATLGAFRVGAAESGEGVVTRRSFRETLVHLQRYVDLYTVFHSMTMGDTVTVQAFCGATNYLRSHGVLLTSCPDIDFSNITGGRDMMYFSDFAAWVLGGRDAVSPLSPTSPHRRSPRDLNSAFGRQRSPSPPGRTLSPPHPHLQQPGQPHTRSVQRGINSGGGGGDWTVRFYQQRDVLGAYGDINSLHRTLDAEAMGVAEGNYLVLQPSISEALFPVASSLKVSKAGHVRKMVSKSYAQVLSTDPEVRRLFLDTYDKSMRCLGVDVDLMTGEAVNEGGRFPTLVSRRGTHFRKAVTRILHSLATFGLSNFQQPLLAMLVDEIATSQAMEPCRDVCRSQWLAVLDDGRAKDELHARLNFANKRKAAGSAMAAVRKQQRRDMLRRGRSPSPTRSPLSAPRRAPSSARRSPSPQRGPSPARPARPVHPVSVPAPAPALAPVSIPVPAAAVARVPPPLEAAQVPSPKKLGAQQQGYAADAVVDTPLADTPVKRVTKWTQPVQGAAHAEPHLPIRLEEDEKCFRLVVLGTPDRVRVTVRLMSLHIRVVPPEASSLPPSSGTVLIDDLGDYAECATRQVHLSQPVSPGSTSKAPWGTRHTVLTVTKMPNDPAEL